MKLPTLTDEQVMAQRHDAEIMRRRHLWPYGPFLPLKHRVAVDLHELPRTAILCYSNSDPRQKRTYIFLPEANMYTIPAEIWTDPSRYRTGEETLIFEIILEGWIVQ